MRSATDQASLRAKCETGLRAIGGDLGLRDWIHFRVRAWRHRFRRERGEVACLLRNIKPGDTVIDVGGNRGAFTYWMCRLTGPKGRVIVFEPQPALVARLESNLPPFRNAKLIQCALSDQPGQANLKIPTGSNSGMATIEGREVDWEHQEVSVPLRRLDDVLTELKAGPITFVKIDVEGHEFAVLRGGEEMLLRDHPVLLFEWQAHFNQDAGIFDWLIERGYVGWFLNDNVLTPFAEFKPEVHQAPGRVALAMNFIFVPVGKEP